MKKRKILKIFFMNSKKLAFWQLVSYFNKKFYIIYLKCKKFQINVKRKNRKSHLLNVSIYKNRE